MDIWSVVRSALFAAEYGSPVNYIQLAKDTVGFFQVSEVEKVVRRIGDAHIQAAVTIAKNIEDETDTRAAMHRILSHLEAAFYIYADYYHRLPKMIEIPYIWMITGLASLISGREKIRKVTANISAVIASYHKALGSNPQLIRKWLYDIPLEKDFFTFHDDKVISDLLGEEELKSYKKKESDAWSSATLSSSYDDDSYGCWVQDL